MRIKIGTDYKDRGKERIIRKFLFLPKTLRVERGTTYSEFRWLCTSYIRQRCYSNGWISTSFVDVSDPEIKRVYDNQIAEFGHAI